MTDFIKVGKILNTFGIKGELKICSDFEYKEKIFKENFPIYIGNDKVKEIIETKRYHKNNYLVLFKGYTNINEVLKYKNSLVYILRSDLELHDNEYLLNDLLNFKVIDNGKEMGKVVEVLKSTANNLVKVQINNKYFFIPLVNKYIIKFDLENKILYTNNTSELM